MAIRDIEAVDALAAKIGLRLIADVVMPANNQTLVWRRTSVPMAQRALPHPQARPREE